MGKKAEATKKRIMDETVSLLQDRSLNNISVREICHASNVAKGTFYLYFEAKEEVAWSILNEKLYDAMTFVADIGQLEPSVEAVYRIIDQAIEFARDNIRFLKVIHNVRFIDYIGEDKFNHQYNNAWIIPLQQFLEKGVEQSVFLVEDILFTTYFISSGIHELIDQVIYDNSPFTLEQLSSKLKGVVLKIVL